MLEAAVSKTKKIVSELSNHLFSTGVFRTSLDVELSMSYEEMARKLHKWSSFQPMRQPITIRTVITAGAITKPMGILPVTFVGPETLIAYRRQCERPG